MDTEGPRSSGALSVLQQADGGSLSPFIPEVRAVSRREVRISLPGRGLVFRACGLWEAFRSLRKPLLPVTHSGAQGRLQGRVTISAGRQEALPKAGPTLGLRESGEAPPTSGIPCPLKLPALPPAGLRPRWEEALLQPAWRWCPRVCPARLLGLKAQCPRSERSTFFKNSLAGSYMKT